MLSDLTTRPPEKTGPIRALNRDILSAAGFLNFVSIVLVWARPFYRFLFDLASGKSMNHHSNIPKHARDDAQLLIIHLGSWNGTRKWSWSFRCHGCTDASLSGFGGIVCDCKDECKVVGSLAGMFSLRELKNIRTSGDMQHAEMFGALGFLTKFAYMLENESILLWIDNEADMFILRRWATKCPRLRSVLRCIAAMCASFNINLKVRHLRSEQNLFADHLSRPKKHKFIFGGLKNFTLVLSNQLRFHPSDPLTHLPTCT